MNIQEILDNHNLILTEAAVIESLRRSGNVNLHPRLENALLIYKEGDKEELSKLYHDFIALACNADVPITICTPTWRANQERISEAHISDDINGDAVKFFRHLKESWGAQAANIFIGGLIGCKNDCYKPDEGLSEHDAKVFHSWQIHRLARAGVDFLMGATLPAISEATGIALSMMETKLPYIISFVINREGKILDGNSLEHAFQEIDTACSTPPLGYMINCAYPSFLHADKQPRSVLSRLIGYQANASSLDQSDLDGAGTLRTNDVSDWGKLMIELNKKYGVKILGGCCGTGHEHLRYIVRNINKKYM
ncbi:MAG: homocysteine S-methyltransferase family protein [Deltaproteobacteria bacterium]|nr:homocysteine S-methyltransferase family protein [Deltaproteobacteria bacterium]